MIDEKYTEKNNEKYNGEDNEILQRNLNDQKLKMDIESNIIDLLDIYIGIVSFFDCSKCGQCCQKSPDLLFSDEFAKFDENVICMKDGLYGIKDPCPFLVENNCKIHNSIKPRLCRFAPFVIGNNQIILLNCQLGKKISNEYNTFIEESCIDIYDMINPFADIGIIKSFLNWLENKNLK